MSSLQKIRTESSAREYEQKRSQEKKRNVLVLMLRFLTDNGYVSSAEGLSREANVSLGKVDVADNVDLGHIVQEYEDFYEVKYGRRPRLTRRTGPEDVVAGGGATRAGAPPVSAAVAAALPGRAAALERRQRSMSGAQPGGGGYDLPGDVKSRASEMARLDGRGAGPRVAQLPQIGDGSEGRGGGRGGGPPSGRGAQDAPEDKAGAARRRPPPAGDSASAAAADAGAGDTADDMGISGMGVVGSKGARGAALPGGAGARPREEEDSGDEIEEFFEMRVLKPMPDLGSSEMRELGQAITRDIYLRNPNTRWEDIAGLGEAKKLLKEAVVMPIKYPQLFQGLLAPWKGVLLYGPPGTGKTMLARAVATECKTTFFNISASSIISKWRGDSEKLVRVLFELARYHAPSTIFLDELDALMSARDGGGGEHEASRRMKTELLIQMDGLARGEELVFLLAATNLPWELDMAMLRRLEKRILVPLPSEEARHLMFKKLLGGLPNGAADSVDHAECARRTEGYSGSDVTVVCKETAMRPLRRVMATLEGGDGGVGGGGGGGAASDLLVGPDGEVLLPPITVDDVDKALSTTKPSARLYAERYNKFHEEYGQVL